MAWFAPSLTTAKYLQGPSSKYTPVKTQHSWLENGASLPQPGHLGKMTQEGKESPQIQCSMLKCYCLMVQKSCQQPVEDGKFRPIFATGFIQYISGSSPDFMNYQQRINWKNDAFSNVFPYQQVREHGMFQLLPTQKSRALRIIGPSKLAI